MIAEAATAPAAGRVAIGGQDCHAQVSGAFTGDVSAEMLRDAGATNQSMLCVGLDPEPSRFPADMKGNANKIYDFCAHIVDATADLVNAFKPQIAYFAAHRAESQLERLMEHIRRVAPHVPIILDAKRGDIKVEVQDADGKPIPGFIAGLTNRINSDSVRQELDQLTNIQRAAVLMLLLWNARPKTSGGHH